MKLKTITRVSIINGMILLILTLSEFLGIWKFPLVLSYQWHKVLHITGVVLFMGNMIVGPFWYSYAYYTKDKTILRFANRLLQLTDLYLTIPGVALTVINGLFLTSIYGGTRNHLWLFYSIILMLVMWALSIPLIFLQEKLYSTIDLESDNDKEINRLLTNWGILGTIVMIPPTIIFYLMIMKPV